MTGLDVLLRSDLFEFDMDAYIPIKELVELYDCYRRLNCLDKIRWSKDHYQPTFEELGLFVMKDTRIWEGVRISGFWVLGIKPRNSCVHATAADIAESTEAVLVNRERVASETYRQSEAYNNCKFSKFAELAAGISEDDDAVDASKTPPNSQRAPDQATQTSRTCVPS